MASEQQDLFGDAETRPKAYVPDPRHVRNRLTDLVDSMERADVWPWDPVMVRLHRERTFSYLLGLLPDREEAEAWRLRIEAETRRLDEAAEAA